MSCAIASCKNYHLKTLNQPGEKISYHSFPNAKNFPSIRKEWINLCKRDDKFNPDSSHICSLHFLESDFEHDVQNESSLGFPSTVRKILKESAIPTLNLTSSMNKKSVSALSEKNSFIEDKENVVLKEKAFNNDNNIMPLQDKQQNEMDVVVTASDKGANVLSQKNFNLLQDKYNKLEHMYNELQMEHKTLKHTLKIKDKRIRSLKEKLVELKRSMPRIGKNTVVESFGTGNRTLFYQQYEKGYF